MNPRCWKNEGYCPPAGTGCPDRCGRRRLPVHGSLLSEIGLPVVGVPKTIDNDLGATDVTFGFYSAVSIVSESLDRLETTANAHQRMMVVEVMGRHAGWIALEGGIAGSADVILLPEIPFSLENVVECIKARKAAGQREILVVVSEGARLADELVLLDEKTQGKFAWVASAR